MILCPIAAFGQGAYTINAKTIDSQSGKGRVISVQPLDSDKRVVFQFKDSGKGTFLGLLKPTENYTARQQLKLWYLQGIAKKSGNYIDPLLYLDLLYWQAALLNPKDYQVPHHDTSQEDASILLRSSREMTPVALTNATKPNSDWIRQVLQPIISNSIDSKPSDDIDQFKTALSRTDESQNILEKIARELELKSAEQGILNNPLEQSILQRKANLLRLLSNNKILVISTRGESGFDAKYGGKSYILTVDNLLFLLSIITSISENMAISEKQCARIKSVVETARKNNISLDPDFVDVVDKLSYVGKSEETEIADAVLNVVMQSIKESAVNTAGQLSIDELKKISKNIAIRLASRGPLMSEFASSFSSTLLSRAAGYSVAFTISDVLFNTSASYDSIRIGYCAASLNVQFDQIAIGLSRKLRSSRSNGLLTAWSDAIYFREMCSVNFHNNYAATLERARLAKVATRILTHGDVDDTIYNEHQHAKNATNDSIEWENPTAVKKLLPFYTDSIATTAIEHKPVIPVNQTPIERGTKPQFNIGMMLHGSLVIQSVTRRAITVPSSSESKIWYAKQGRKLTISPDGKYEARRASLDGVEEAIEIADHTTHKVVFEATKLHDLLSQKSEANWTLFGGWLPNSNHFLVVGDSHISSNDFYAIAVVDVITHKIQKFNGFLSSNGKYAVVPNAEGLVEDDFTHISGDNEFINGTLVWYAVKMDTLKNYNFKNTTRKALRIGNNAFQITDKLLKDGYDEHPDQMLPRVEFSGDGKWAICRGTYFTTVSNKLVKNQVDFLISMEQGNVTKLNGIDAHFLD